MYISHQAVADLTETGTTQRWEIGATKLEPYLDSGGTKRFRVWRYIQNDAAAATAFEVGDVVIADPSAATLDDYGCVVAPVTTATRRTLVRGICQHAIPSGHFGWVGVYGLLTVKIGTGNISADTALTTGGSRVGAVIDAVANADATTDTYDAVIGHSIAAETTDNTTITAFINMIP